MIKQVCVSALVFCCLIASARDTSTSIFDPNFKSLRVIDAANRVGYPIMNLHSDAAAVGISFDELAECERQLRYRLVHCNSD